MILGLARPKPLTPSIKNRGLGTEVSVIKGVDCIMRAYWAVLASIMLRARYYK